jgi:hypothetical protein
MRFRKRQSQPVRLIINTDYGTPPVPVELQVILNGRPLDTMTRARKKGDLWITGEDKGLIPIGRVRHHDQ